jgi:hypothetical protein
VAQQKTKNTIFKSLWVNRIQSDSEISLEKKTGYIENNYYFARLNLISGAAAKDCTGSL